MANQRVNPNRMELMRLRKRGQVAQRGHKLLKDKLDELMKEFLSRIGENRRLRARGRARAQEAYGMLAVARGEAGRANLAQALSAGRPEGLVDVAERNVMSVRIPEFAVMELPDPAATR